MGSKKSGSDNSAAIAAQQEAQRQSDITTGTNSINSTFDSQFTPDYYAKIAKGYTDYADPQLDSQYKDTQKQLTYSLARDGNLDSSTRGDQEGSLSQLYNTNKLNIANQAQGYSNAAQSNVETSRTGLINSLNQTGDAAGAANEAATTAGALAATPSYSALGDLFSSTTSALSQQAQLERAQAISAGAYQAPYNTGMFGNLGAPVAVT